MFSLYLRTIEHVASFMDSTPIVHRSNERLLISRSSTTWIYSDKQKNHSRCVSWHPNTWIGEHNICTHVRTYVKDIINSRDGAICSRANRHHLLRKENCYVILFLVNARDTQRQISGGLFHIRSDLFPAQINLQSCVKHKTHTPQSVNYILQERNKSCPVYNTSCQRYDVR